MHPSPEPWVTRLLTALGGPKPRLLGSSGGWRGSQGWGTYWGSTPGRLYTTVRNFSPEPSPTPLSPAGHLGLPVPSPLLGTSPLLVSGSGSRKGQPKHLSQPPWLCPFQVLATLAVYPTTTPPLQPFCK